MIRHVYILTLHGTVFPAVRRPRVLVVWRVERGHPSTISIVILVRITKCIIYCTNTVKYVYVICITTTITSTTTSRTHQPTYQPIIYHYIYVYIHTCTYVWCCSAARRGAERAGISSTTYTTHIHTRARIQVRYPAKTREIYRRGVGGPTGLYKLKHLQTYLHRRHSLKHIWGSYGTNASKDY